MKKVLILNLCNKTDTLHTLEFIKPIETIVRKSKIFCEVKHYLQKINYSSYSHIIICGVPLKDFEYENHISTFDWILNYENKLLGICAGAQILSQVAGNSLVKRQEIGLQKVDMITNDIIFETLNFPLEIYGLHNNSFDDLNNFNILLQGEFPQMIKHIAKKHYGCLFHPEVRNHKLIENFINM